METNTNSSQQNRKPSKQIDTKKIELKRRNKKNNNSQMKVKKKKSSFKSKLWVAWCVIFSLIFVATIAVGTVVVMVYYDTLEELPAMDLEKVKTPYNTIVYDHVGNEVADLAEDSLIMVESYDELSQSLIDAFSATEDARFLNHRGIDGPRTVKAVLGTYIFQSGESGGSTITQQLVKQTLLADKIALDEQYKFTEQRKIDEWMLSFLLEKEMTKEEILVSYLNNAINYGRFTGVGTAARRYFNKTVSELTVPEAALLAGIPQLPAENNPFYAIDTATERYQEVIGLMEYHDYITADEAKAALNMPLADLVVRNQDAFTNQNAAYFTAVEAELAEIFKGEENDEGSPVYYTNYRVYTALNQEQQAFANQIMETNDYVDWDTAVYYTYGSEYTYDEGMNFQGAFTVVDVNTGAIPAVGASRNVRETGLNIAVTGYRSPGSSIKPIVDYTPAVEKLNWGAQQVLNDRVTYYSGTSSQVYNYNYGAHSGFVTMEYAIAESLNTTAVQAIQQVGLEDAAKIATSMGITKAYPLYQQGLLGEAAALGGGLEVTTKELAAAYATLGNGGYYNTPHTVTKVEDIVTGEVIWEYNAETDRQQVLKESTAATMTQALIHTRTSGTVARGRKQVSYNIQFAAKTGTSSYSSDEINAYGVSAYAEKDHWHVGYSPTYSIAAWTGLSVEGEEVLLRTGGNSNNNKAVGSYLMASWMNEFGNDGASFSFLGAANASSKGSISDFGITINNASKTISWSEPTINYPSGITDEDKESFGGLIYDITVETSSGTGYNATTTNTSTTYPSGYFDSGTVIVTARINNDKTTNVMDNNTQSNSGLSNPRKNDETTGNNVARATINTSRIAMVDASEQPTTTTTATLTNLTIFLTIISQITSFDW